MCPVGPRPTLDCRGVLQQYSRDFKADLDAMSKFKVSLGTTSKKLMEADVFTSDLLQHYYHTCTLYNGCVISAEAFAAKSERLQDIQLRIRRTLAGGGAGGVYASQQNIQINPPPAPGIPPPGNFPPPPADAYPPPPPDSFPPGDFPSPPDSMSRSGDIPPAGFDAANPPGVSTQTGGNENSLSVSIPPVGGSKNRADQILDLLREGSQLLRQVPGKASPQPISAPSTPANVAPKEDLDTNLRGLLLSLKEKVSNQNPALSSGSTVVGNFNEAGKSWSSPLGALLKDRVAEIVSSGNIFKPASQTRGITIRDVANVPNPNDPSALGAIYNAELAIAGSYRPESGNVTVHLIAVGGGGKIAEASKTISSSAIPEVVDAVPENGPQTSQLLDSLEQLGPRSQGKSQVRVTTNKPGDGANFRLGEEIKYFITAGSDGYLYLFHVDADKNVLRIFPNQYLNEARVTAGTTLEVPGPGAPFKFEASPPFGLETTFAVVTPAPLSEADFQRVEGGFSKPKVEVPNLVATRGVSVKPAGPGSTAPLGGSGTTNSAATWNSVTVLIRP